MIHEQFYQELGKFLYAIALADGTIQEKEIKKVEKLIRDELRLLKKDHIHIEYKEIIFTKLEFHNCIREHYSLKETRDSFLNFIQKYAGKIDNHHKALASKLIVRIAEAFRGRNKMEENLELEAEKFLNINISSS